MKISNSIYLLLLTISLFACKNLKEDIFPYAPIPSEVYPDDSILINNSSKKAIIIIAHDDDMSGMSGTIAKLNKEGWELQVLSFHMSRERDEAHQLACRDITDTVIYFDLEYSDWRKDLNLKNQEELYLPVAKEKFGETFNNEVVEQQLIQRTNNFKPSVIFTLDNEIGAYGHPEHVFISQLVLDLAQSKKISVQFIYQSVYTPHMTSSIMNRHSKRMIAWGLAGDGWEKAKATYMVTGMPTPTNQILIQNEAEEKMRYLKSYNEREQKTIGFFIPAFMEYSSDEYFSVFDREFFNVIPIE
jgi:LmbE family N-acetylglucosaminyl deacetylase